MGEAVRLELTADEALVVFEFAFRYSDTDTSTAVEQAEQRALWNLQCLFERQLIEPFRPDYAALLAAARDRLRDSQQ